MSVDGPLAAAYVNPGGFVHDILTVAEAVNLRRPSLRTHGFQGIRWTTTIHCVDSVHVQIS